MCHFNISFFLYFVFTISLLIFLMSQIAFNYSFLFFIISSIFLVDTFFFVFLPYSNTNDLFSILCYNVSCINRYFPYFRLHIIHSLGCQLNLFVSIFSLIFVLSRLYFLFSLLNVLSFFRIFYTLPWLSIFLR